MTAVDLAQLVESDSTAAAAVTEKELLNRLKFFVDGETEESLMTDSGNARPTLNSQSMMMVRANNELISRTKTLRDIEKFIEKAQRPELNAQKGINLS